jgi:hypothetical protein
MKECSGLERSSMRHLAGQAQSVRQFDVQSPSRCIHLHGNNPPKNTVGPLFSPFITVKGQYDGEPSGNSETFNLPENFSPFLTLIDPTVNKSIIRFFCAKEY